MFTNEPPTDFTIASNREAFSQAFRQLDKDIESGKLFCKPIINGIDITTNNIIKSINPSRSEHIIGEVHFSDLSHVDMAIQNLNGGANAWRNTSAEKRSDIIKTAAAIMRSLRHYLSSLIVDESGKTWKEADADVTEAIDFCRFYADEAVRISPTRLTMEVPGERNTYYYQPRGLTVVIAPWNFPLAIACGMASAALVTGNTVILKPAEQTSLIAYQFSRILLEAGVPKDAFALLPGIGETIGRALVDNPATAMICFTGSKNVGLDIMSRATTIHNGQFHIKKVIAELGGKNCIIVDEDADIDEAIKGVLSSAFGFAGQKCSACSRVVVVGDAYDTFTNRLVDAASDLIVGDARTPASFFGPVIDQESQTRILDTINKASQDLKVAFMGKAPKGGFYVPPVIFRDVDPKHSIWCEEIFGPVLAIMAAADFENALALANDSQYALTGGLYSRSPQNIEKATSQFRVGNLYINRSITGAIVCRQPFGGFKLSGIGSKAGGVDYLLQFVEPITITENTMRRGFAPEN